MGGHCENDNAFEVATAEAQVPENYLVDQTINQHAAKKRPHLKFAARMLCEQYGKVKKFAVQEKCRLWKKNPSDKAKLWSVIRSALNFKDYISKRKYFMKWKSCRNWHKTKSQTKQKTVSAAGKVAEKVFSEASPFMHCLCGKGRNGESYCTLKHTRSLKKTVDTFDKASIGNSIKVFKGRKTRAEVLAHPMFSELFRAIHKPSGKGKKSLHTKLLQWHSDLENKLRDKVEKKANKKVGRVCKQFKKRANFLIGRR